MSGMGTLSPAQEQDLPPPQQDAPPPLTAGLSEDPVEKARRIIGDMDALEAAERFPEETWKVWESTHPRDYNENSEAFKEKLDIFKSNARVVKRSMLKYGYKFEGFNNIADAFYWDGFKGGMMPGPYRGGVPHEYPPGASRAMFPDSPAAAFRRP